MTETIGQRIVVLHHELRERCPALSRMAVAIYDRENDLLKTFVDSTREHESLNHYSVALQQVPSLKDLAEKRCHRIIDDLTTLNSSNSAHTQWLLKQGFRSSYTVPLFGHDQLIGFLFFDADKPRYFDQLIVKTIDVYADLICSVLINELAPLFMLRGALNTAQHLTHHRDTETAAHLSRMSHYSHLLATSLTESHQLDDEYSEFILQYSPLHDIGKIGISDEILLKPGKLSEAEFEVIKSHVQIGLDIIDSIISEFDLGGFSHLSILKNIVGCHHEKYDGSGYPDGLSGEDIPLEGRIVALADVLDALTQPRPYKQAWNFEHAVSHILKLSGSHFDPACCQALDQQRELFREIYQRFSEPSNLTLH